MSDSTDSASGGTIYLDSAASAALRPEALDALLPYLTSEFANPSAHHEHGRHAHDAIEGARDDVAEIFACIPEEIVFTSGGTESINAAIKGVAVAQSEAGVGRHILTTEIEHHAVLHSAQYLERFGFEVELLPVDEYGRVTPDQVAASVRPDTALVSVGYANNEVGTV
ncbi:MAG: aminotransferase class V-fold PLP-dependent enzyme, partial [Dehalococcoidia bacterium]